MTWRWIDRRLLVILHACAMKACSSLRSLAR